jgi:hypothetical protein
MNKIFLSLILIFSLSAANSLEIKNNRMFDLSMFNTGTENKEIYKDNQIKCRVVCDRKISKEQLLKSAINFYKNSKDYHFDTSSYK